MTTHLMVYYYIYLTASCASEINSKYLPIIMKLRDLTSKILSSTQIIRTCGRTIYRKINQNIKFNSICLLNLSNKSKLHLNP